MSNCASYIYIHINRFINIQCINIYKLFLVTVNHVSGNTQIVAVHRIAHNFLSNDLFFVREYLDVKQKYQERLCIYTYIYRSNDSNEYILNIWLYVYIEAVYIWLC